MTEVAGRGRRLRGAAGRVFPGQRAVWLGALVVVLFGSVLLGRMLVARTASTTGTNSVDVAAVIAHAKPGQTTCVRDLVIPKRTGRIQVWLGVVEQGRRPQLDAWVPAAGPDAPRLALRSPALAPGGGYKTFTLEHPLARTRTEATVCLRARGQAVDYGGASVMRLPGAAVSSVSGRPLAGVEIGVLFSRAQGDSPRVADALTAALHRSTLFEPGAGGVAIYVLLLALLLGGYGIVRVAATAEAHSVRRLALLAAALALVHSCAWILLLQPFHGADESEHFAYVQHVATTGHKPAESQTDPGAPYSSSELRLMEAVHHNSTILNQTSKLRWDRFYEQEYQRSVHPDPSIADGGGYTESASGHSALYYAVAGLPYRLMGRPSTLPTALTVTRLFSALIAALVAALAVYTASYMLPERRAAAWLAGVLVALQPVFASVSAAVNNDTAVNVLAALLVFLAIRTWRRGVTPRSAVLLGAVAVLAPVAKITGFALLPPLGLLLLALVAAQGLRPTARWAAFAGAGALVTAFVWVFALGPLLGGERGRLVNQHPVAGAAAAAAPSARLMAAATPVPAPPPPLSVTPVGKVEYFVQTYLPSLHVGGQRWALSGAHRLDRWPAFRIYIDRGYGLFGWNSTGGLSYGVLQLILLGLAAGWALALLAAVRARARWRSWGGGALILIGSVLSVLLFVSYAYAKPDVVTDPGEQGRYLFTALVPLAVLFSGALVAFRGRLGQVLVGGAVAAPWVLALVAYTTALRAWFM